MMTRSNGRSMLWTAAAICWAAAAASAEPLRLTVTEDGDARDTATAEIRGVGAGAFDPASWSAGRLNWVTDDRRPFMEPRDGQWRNIYAPSAVQTAEGWRVFYGGWDGVATGKDRIYSTATKDFLSFGERSTVIEHGVFQHVCNVNALGAPGGGFEMVCTSYPDAFDRNKPAFFASADGATWNGSPAPYAAGFQDIVRVAGYEKYDDADINGMNVLLREEDALRLYFSSFRDFGKVYRASAPEGTSFTLDGVALEERLMVNDVKRFRAADGDWYVMGLHRNGGELRYALSRDGKTFEPSRTLFESSGGGERYIVALGWVVDGAQEREGRRMLGVLYGAGAIPSLDKNRIFARWLQKRAVFTAADGTRTEGAAALGPDRQLLSLPGTGARAGRLELFAEDGVTPLAACDVRLKPGKAYVARLE